MFFCAFTALSFIIGFITMSNCFSVYPISATEIHKWNTTQEQDAKPICLFFSILVKCIDFPHLGI